MEQDKEVLEAMNKLEKAMDEGVPEMSKKNLLLLILLCQLKDTLAELEKYKATGPDSAVKKCERRLEGFEGLIDKKYWDEFSLFYIIMALGCRQADNLKKAIEMLEDFNKKY